MQPVRVKYYGLLSLTRQQYLTVQSVLLVLFLILLAAVLALPMPEGLRKAADTDPIARSVRWVWQNFLWLGLAALALEVIETVLMLRKFARKEAEQRTGSPGMDPAASPNQQPG